MGGVATGRARTERRKPTPRRCRRWPAPEDTFGLLRGLLEGLQTACTSSSRNVERRNALAAATPSIWPTHGWLSSTMGNRADPITGDDDFHPGLDIAADKGQPVYATADGTVAHAGLENGYGNLVVARSRLRPRNPLRPPLSFTVKQGDKVKRGDLIGRVGATGRATGPTCTTRCSPTASSSIRCSSSPSSKPRDRVTRPFPRSAAVSLPIVVAAWLQSVDIHSRNSALLTMHDRSTARQGHRHAERARAQAAPPACAEINALEPPIQALTDEQLRGKTAEFRQRLADGETLDDLLPEAFAVVREAGRRVLNMRHFDVQLIGGMVLHRGKIAEMKTGEGKTLVATLPAYLNALDGKGVHVVTVNDYLARRDSEWMGRIYRFLGMTRRRHPARPERPGAAGRLRLPTSPTAPTTSSASTTCATT